MACKPAVTVQGSEGRHLTWANGWSNSEFMSASHRRPTGPSVRLSSCNVRHPHKGLDAVLERPQHGVRVQPKSKGRCALVHVQLAVRLGGQGHALLVEQVAHQGLGRHVGECCVASCVGQVTPDKVVLAVLPIPADGERRLDVGPLVEWLRVGRPHNAHAGAEELVPVVVAVDVPLGT